MDSSPALLKERAAALELRKHPEQALRLYHQLLDKYGGTEHVDVTVRNRVGDLHLRLKQIDEAVATTLREPLPDPNTEDWCALASRHLSDGFHAE